LEYIRKNNANAVGVDIRANIVDANRAKGFKCFLVDEFKKRNEQDFDVILMSHVIEHMSPEKLLEAFRFYLKSLKKGGIILIATPFVSHAFYNEFDHQKQYNPESILYIFNEQFGPGKIVLKDISFYNSKFRIEHVKWKVIEWKYMGLFQKISKRVGQMTEFVLAIAYYCSFGFIGHLDGWVGVFVKEEDVV
jgi:SAM-dependent methyltransferase